MSKLTLAYRFSDGGGSAEAKIAEARRLFSQNYYPNPSLIPGRVLNMLDAIDDFVRATAGVTEPRGQLDFVLTDFGPGEQIAAEI